MNKITEPIKLRIIELGEQGLTRIDILPIINYEFNADITCKQFDKWYYHQRERGNDIKIDKSENTTKEDIGELNKKILELHNQGYTNKEIAEKLNEANSQTVLSREAVYGRLKTLQQKGYNVHFDKRHPRQGKRYKFDFTKYSIIRVWYGNETRLIDNNDKIVAYIFKLDDPQRIEDVRFRMKLDNGYTAYCKIDVRNRSISLFNKYDDLKAKTRLLVLNEFNSVEDIYNRLNATVQNKDIIDYCNNYKNKLDSVENDIKECGITCYIIHGGIIDTTWTDHIFISPLNLRLIGYTAENTEVRRIYRNAKNVLIAGIENTISNYKFKEVFGYVVPLEKKEQLRTAKESLSTRNSKYLMNNDYINPFIKGESKIDRDNTLYKLNQIAYKMLTLANDKVLTFIGDIKEDTKRNLDSKSLMLTGGNF